MESFYRISYVSTTRYTIIQQLTRNTTYSRMKVRTIAFLHSSSSPPPQTETIFVTISLEIFSKSVRPCNEATPSALFSSSSFQTIVTQRSVNKRELISCCPTRFVSGNLDKFFSTKGRQTKHVFVRAVLVRENGSLLAPHGQLAPSHGIPCLFTGNIVYRYTKTVIHAKRIEIELVNKNPFPQPYLHSPPLSPPPLSLDSFQSRTTGLSKGISSTSLGVENLDRRKRSQLNLDVTPEQLSRGHISSEGELQLSSPFQSSPRCLYTSLIYYCSTEK